MPTVALAEHLEKLRYLVRLADYSSIKKAAETIGISQAGLSKSVAHLEEILDVKLFFRSPTGLVWTPEGRATLAAARDILARASSLEADLKKQKSHQNQFKTSVGIYDSIAIYLFRDLADFIQTTYPKAHFMLTVTDSQSLHHLAEQNQLDIAIGVGLPANYSSLIVHSLFEDSFSIYTNKEILSEPSLTPLILNPRIKENHDGQTIKSFLQRRGALKGRATHEVINIETIKALTLQGLGFGVLPTKVAFPLVKRGRLKEVSLPKVPSQFFKHQINLLASKMFAHQQPGFISDLVHLIQRWSKT